MEVDDQLHAPAVLPPRKKPPVASWAPEPVSTLEKRKISCPCRESNAGSPACSPPLYRLSYPGSRLLFPLNFKLFNVKGKAIPVTGRGGPLCCETSRLPHFLDNRLTDGGEVVSLTRRPPFNPWRIPGTHFC
jgi:hypothetical protein